MEFFKFKSTNVLRSGLFVGQKWQIQHYDWSDRLSNKLPAKGQLANIAHDVTEGCPEV